MPKVQIIFDGTVVFDKDVDTALVTNAFPTNWTGEQQPMHVRCFIGTEESLKPHVAIDVAAERDKLIAGMAREEALVKRQVDNYRACLEDRQPPTGGPAPQ